VPPGCHVSLDNQTYTMSPEQTVHATTIAAVGKRMGLPDHAVSVALAAALQESRLHNLGHGDRDSVGLFQQRPSQGWGSASQLLTPTYAAGAFYRHLARVPGWEALPVTTAAQRVQRSAAPSAYAQWEHEARAIAQAATGEIPAGLSCRADVGPTQASKPLRQALARTRPVDTRRAAPGRVGLDGRDLGRRARAGVRREPGDLRRLCGTASSGRWVAPGAPSRWPSASPRSAERPQLAGGMFWLWQKRFVGSHLS
jgi:hypothetical protein